MACCCFNTHNFVFSYLVFNSEIIEIGFESVLSCEAGINQIGFLFVPFFQTSVIEKLQVILDDKRHNVVFEALFEKNKSANTTITVLERVYAFKSYMELNNIVKGDIAF